MHRCPGPFPTPPRLRHAPRLAPSPFPTPPRLRGIPSSTSPARTPTAAHAPPGLPAGTPWAPGQHSAPDWPPFLRPLHLSPSLRTAALPRQLPPRAPAPAPAPALAVPVPRSPRLRFDSDDHRKLLRLGPSGGCWSRLSHGEAGWRLHFPFRLPLLETEAACAPVNYVLIC
ncbi:hypothetical protein GQ55_9G307900 [Panicum hallii var. hallii]|uniref:Uncharacterized protein n=1 Tax=Panicum hallii var. hallii TaxID=1504633 RepID=A0A2T7C7X7_9POAL|nr:hypothetical protein GQ55_9G307900 [Panicum hallii var. hallii]